MAAGRITNAFAAAHLQQFGLSIPEWRLLAHVAQVESASVRDIHAKLDLEKSRVSRTIVRLEEAGYLERRAHAEDKRLLDLRLSEGGLALMALLVPAAKAFQAEAVQALGPDGEVFQRVLRQFLDLPT
jgi:DNA-binding MarR family transcriptional regulator